MRDNVFGIYLHGDGAATTLARRNLLDGNNRAGSAQGNGIYSDQGALGTTVRANSFRNHINAGILFATAGTQQESIIIQNNCSLNDNRFVALFNVQNAQVVANQTNDDIDGDDFGSTIFVGGEARPDPHPAERPGEPRVLRDRHPGHAADLHRCLQRERGG